MKNKSPSDAFEFIDDRERKFAGMLSQLSEGALNRMLDLAGTVLLAEQDEAHRSSAAQDERQI